MAAPVTDLNIVVEKSGLSFALSQARSAEWQNDFSGATAQAFYDSLTLAHIAAREVPAALFVQRRAGAFANKVLRATVSALERDGWGEAVSALNTLPQSILRDLAIRRVTTDGVEAVMKIYPGTLREAAAARINVDPALATAQDPLLSNATPMAKIITTSANLMRLPLERSLE